MDPVDAPVEAAGEDRDDDIPAYLLDGEPERTQFGLKTLFWFTTVCGCYFAVERLCNGRAAAMFLVLGLPLIWLFFLGLTITERVMALPGLIVLAAILSGLVAFGAFLAYGG
jgi:hypothetical protein